MMNPLQILASFEEAERQIILRAQACGFAVSQGIKRDNRGTYYVWKKARFRSRFDEIEAGTGIWTKTTYTNALCWYGTLEGVERWINGWEEGGPRVRAR